MNQELATQPIRIAKSRTAIQKLTIAEFRLRSQMRPELTIIADRIRQAREDIEPGKVEVKPDDEHKDPEDLLTLLKEHGDLLITVFKTLPTNKDVRKRAKQLFDHVKSLQNGLRDLGKELVEALGGSDEELKDLDESAMGSIKKALEQQSKEVGNLLKAAQLIKTYERKATVDIDQKPVKHKLPRKDKKEKERSQIKTKGKDEKKEKPDRELKDMLKDL